MDKVINKAIELNNEIKTEPIVVEYLRLKALFEQSVELELLRQDIAKASQEIDKTNYNELKKMYDNHPLVYNFYLLQEEVINILSEISNIINA